MTSCFLFHGNSSYQTPIFKIVSPEIPCLIMDSFTCPGRSLCDTFDLKDNKSSVIIVDVNSIKMHVCCHFVMSSVCIK